MSQHIIQEVSCATYRCGHQVILTGTLGFLVNHQMMTKNAERKKIAGKKHAIATIKLPNQMPVCECTIVEEKSEMRTKKNRTYILRCKKNNRFKIYEMKKKLVKSLFNVCHCSCCWCCDNNMGHCKLLSCKNYLQ